MQQIQLLITAKAPLAIARQKIGSSISDVETYIPGSVLRGAIAGLMLRQAQAEEKDFSQEADSDFKTLFIDNQAVFHNAYPAVTEDLRLHSNIRVMPATALSSKNASGFKPKKNGVFDTLIDRFCADAYGQIYDPNCPTDGDRVDPFKGFYSLRYCFVLLIGLLLLADEESSNQASQETLTWVLTSLMRVKQLCYYNHSATSRLLTRVGINRRRGTAEDQVLYSLQVLNETKRKDKQVKDMVFAGSIWICDELAEEFCNYLEQQSQHIRVGGSASRGLGKIEIQPTLVDHQSTVGQRMKDFNAVLKNRWERWTIFGTQPNIDIQTRYFFTLDLQSDAILVEQWQRTMVISPTMLQQAVGRTSGDLQLHASYSSYGYRSGWNTAWGLHKDMELTTDRGSVFLFSIDKSDQAAWETALEDLEIWGIGNATTEGFGQVKVCDEFHNVLREAAV